MINKTYFSNFLQTYSWQSISVFLNLISMVVVIPLLTSNPVIYGIYSICISMAIYLNYADIGFITACYKYAGESYINKKYDLELKLYGFASFVMFLFVSFIVFFFIYFSINPSLLIKDIGNQINIDIASKLLLIQAIFSYNIVLQRFYYGILSIRIEQFIFDRINILGSFFKIISIFYFFNETKYDIVGYFLFTKIVELLVIVVSAVIVREKYNISFISFIKVFKFNKEIFVMTKKLALGSLFATVMWIIYYELDLIVIGKLLGPLEASYFAAALIAVKFFRTFASIIYGPFLHRYNHYSGDNDFDGLKNLVFDVIKLSMPLIVLSAIVVILYGDIIILTWLGEEYVKSSFLLRLLTFNFLMSFIIIPSSNILIVTEKIKKIYLINLALAISYWLGIFLLINEIGVDSFAVSKLLSGLISVFFYLVFLLKYLNISFLTFLKQTIFKLTLPIIFLLLTRILFYNNLINLSLISLIIFVIVSLLISLAILYLTSNYYKRNFNNYGFKFIKKIK